MNRTALCIGLNYPGSGNDLSGCVNDARDWSEALGARGFSASTVFEPTAPQMRQLMADAVGGAKSGDTVFITYSGHGSWVPDESGDEPDGHDECICPADIFSTGRGISDDELFGIFANRHRGVRLVFVSDSCHSGTVARFAPPPAGAEQGPRVRFLPPETFLYKRFGELSDALRLLRPAPVPTVRALKSTALLFGGCADWEFSYDATFNGRGNGAFTRAAIDALAALPAGSTYRQWYAAIRERLPTAQYPQTPSLVGTSDQKRLKLP